MMKKSNYSGIWTVLFVILFIAFCSQTACVISHPMNIEDQLTKEFSVKKGQLFYLKTDFGSVEVKSWDRDQVKLNVTKKARTSSQREADRLFEDLKIRFDQDNNGVQVVAEYTGHKSWLSGRRRVNLHFEVIVPNVFDLDVNTSGGSIKVEDLAGNIDLNTSGGSISVGQIKGPVNAKTSGGSINVSEAVGDVFVHTSGGRINIGKTSGAVDAKTSGGGINLDGVEGNTTVRTSGGSLNLKKLGGTVQGSTSGGSIYAELTGNIDSDCYLKTSGGGITVYLPEDASVDIDAQTSGGRVSIDFPVTVQGKLKSNYLNGKINEGGPLVKLRTSGGGIRIKEWTQ